MQEKTKRRTVTAMMTGVLVALVGLRLWKRKPTASATELKVQSPTQLSFRDWRHALLGAKQAFGNKNLPVLAAGVAYFSTLSFFPMFAAAVAIAAFVIRPEQLHHLITGLESYLPADMASLVTTQLEHASGKKAGNIIVAVIAIAISLFGASGAVSNLITASNVSYNCKETRGFFKLKALSLLLTLGAILAGFMVVGLLALNAQTFAWLGLPSFVVTALLTVRWLLLILFVMLAMAVFFRYGPNRQNPRWQWVSWGALLATTVWLIGTVLFFVYVQYFGNFSKSYSLFAGIIVLMTWLNLSAFITLFAAEINHKLEQQALKKEEANN